MNFIIVILYDFLVKKKISVIDHYRNGYNKQLYIFKIDFFSINNTSSKFGKMIITFSVSVIKYFALSDRLTKLKHTM